MTHAKNKSCENCVVIEMDKDKEPCKSCWKDKSLPNYKSDKPTATVEEQFEKWFYDAPCLNGCGGVTQNCEFCRNMCEQSYLAGHSSGKQESEQRIKELEHKLLIAEKKLLSLDKTIKGQ